MESHPQADVHGDRALDLSNDAGEKGCPAPPDLARHAANLMEKMHTPDLNWKVRGQVIYFASPVERFVHHITVRLQRLLSSWRSIQGPFQKGRSLGQRRCAGYADGNFLNRSS